MAKYHTNLKYHEDTIKKRNITDEELSFLKDLQKELNTQDHVGQADPRFWVIKGTEKLYGVEEADGYVLYYCETVAESTEELCEFITNNWLEDIKERTGIPYEINLEPSVLGRNIIAVKFPEYDSITGECNDEYEYLDSAEEIKEWLEQFGYEELEVISYKIVDKIYEDTMFLTQKDAEDHLRANYYHYSDDCHTYAMTAWRSPRVEKLVKLLQEVDFDALTDN